MMNDEDYERWLQGSEGPNPDGPDFITIAFALIFIVLLMSTTC